MIENNVCIFNIARADSDGISILNFVHEKGSGIMPYFIVHSVFRLHVIIGGSGYVHIAARTEKLVKGDIFLTFPSTEYKIESDCGLEYTYISFMGLRGYKLLARTQLNKKNFILHCKDQFIPFWLSALGSADTDNIDLLAESTLLYTLGKLCVARSKNQSDEINSNIIYLKKQAENRFCDPDINLKSLCAEIFYNPKAASSAFRKQTGIRFSEFLTALRINNAVRLIENGCASVKQIAAESGFRDSLYFSRVYKQAEGVSPTADIAARKHRNLTAVRNDS